MLLVKLQIKIFFVFVDLSAIFAYNKETDEEGGARCV
jgi:hypothetical protein